MRTSSIISHRFKASIRRFLCWRTSLEDDHDEALEMVRNELQMEEGPWAGLLDDILAQVFDRVSFEERLKVLPLVCKDWKRVARSSSAWRSVDMDPWMRYKAEELCDWEGGAESEMGPLIRKVVNLSQGQLRSLRTGYCTNEGLDFIASNCPLLEELSVRNSFMVDDEAAMNLASHCNRLQKVDLSDCYNISAKSLESFGTNCRIVHLSRNMTDIGFNPEATAPRVEEEAEAIATHMSTLKVLELRRMSSMKDSDLATIVSRCSSLERLDLACCTSLSSHILDRLHHLCPTLKDVVKPIKPRLHIADPKRQMLGLYSLAY